MSKAEFTVRATPSFFSNRLGYCRLDVFLDTSTLIGAGYRTSDGKLFIVSYANTWKELYEKLSLELNERGLLLIKALS